MENLIQEVKNQPETGAEVIVHPATALLGDQNTRLETQMILSGVDKELGEILAKIQSNPYALDMIAEALDLNGAQKLKLSINPDYLTDMLSTYREFKLNDLSTEQQATIKKQADTLFSRGFSRAAAVILATCFFMMSCDPSTIKPGGEVVRTEIQRLTVDQWIAQNNINLQVDLKDKNGNALGVKVISKVVVGDDGRYYLKPNLKPNISVINEMAESVSETSGVPIGDLELYISFRNVANSQGGQWFKIGIEKLLSSSDILASDMEVFISGSNDLLEKEYRPGDEVFVSCSVYVPNFSKLSEAGAITIENQENFYQKRDSFHNLGR